MATAYIALGANLGDRLQTMRQAVARLGALGQVTGLSDVYETDPVGVTEQPDFLNAVARLETALAPEALMTALLDIERELGRVRTIKYGPRTIDLDLLFAGDAITASDHLTLPHPRLHERGFVLVPLAELAPDLLHPRLRRTVRELLEQQKDLSGVRPFARFDPGAANPAHPERGWKEIAR